MKTTINGTDINYSIIGDQGPWIVMSHSLGCTQAMWDHQLDVLKDYRLLRYDTRGHGGSGSSEPPYTLDLLADDALMLMDHLGIQKAHWLGFSMGGMIGQVLALKYPDRVLSLILADTTSEHKDTPHSMWQERIRTAREQGIPAVAGPAITRWFTEEFRTHEPKQTQWVTDMVLETTIDGWCGCCAAIADVQTTDRLHEITCPALVIVGERDIGTPLEAALTIHRHLKASTLVVISDAAHMTCIEQPEQFNRALTLFLNTAA
ncbi:3-oxoadipate enol-lactonase 2 [Vreelandella titanicae]